MILFRVEKCLCFFTTAGVTHTPAVYSHKYTNSMMYVCPKNNIFEGNSQEDAVNMVRERARQVDAIRNILQIVRVDVIIHWSEYDSATRTVRTNPLWNIIVRSTVMVVYWEEAKTIIFHYACPPQTDIRYVLMY